MPRPILLAGQFVATGLRSSIRAPFSGEVVADVHLAGARELEQALAAAHQARESLGSTSTGERRRWLTEIARGLGERLEELARAIALEAGKPITLARGEVRRAIETFTLAAAELTSWRGETVPIDLDAASAGYSCVVRRVPAGIVAAISPFNFPLNLAAHKVAPAIAVGAPCILKPPPQSPTPTLILAELAQRAGVPEGALSVLPCDNAIAEKLATDPRVKVVSFTGSAKVGWHLKQAVPRAKVVLELGGNAAAIVCADADLEHAAQRLAMSAFAYAGQVCISTQRIFVEESIREAFTGEFLRRVKQLRVGDPLDEATVVGPVIDDRAAERIQSWMDDARARGAQVLLGGPREGRMIPPQVLAEVPPDATLAREEVFGPVALIDGFADFEGALRRVNDADWGLQAALFTHDLRRVRRAEGALEVGGLIINDSPSFRSDAYPYGGVKGSGLGREGLRYAMEELTEPRAVITARG